MVSEASTASKKNLAGGRERRTVPERSSATPERTLLPPNNACADGVRICRRAPCVLRGLVPIAGSSLTPVVERPYAERTNSFIVKEQSVKLGIRCAVVACLCASMGACSSGSDSGGGSAGSGAEAGSADAGRAGNVATGKGGAGSGGAPAGSGGAEVAHGGSAGADLGSGGHEASATGGAAGSSGAGAGAGGTASSGGAAGAATSGGTAGAATSGGAAGAANSGGTAGAATSGGTAGTSSGPKCSTTTVVASNAVARDTNGEGLVTQTDVCVPELGVISSITLKYKLSKFFGDPTRQAVFAYQADFSIYNAFWVAQVMTTSGDPVMVNDKLVYVSWLEGSWPPPGGTFGTDSTGSPWWYETFSYYSGGMTRDGYVDETNAKAIYAAGFTLDRLRMVRINGKAVLY